MHTRVCVCVCVCVCTVTHLCPHLCNPMNCSPPASFVHEIFQARKSGEGCHFLHIHREVQWRSQY